MCRELFGFCLFVWVEPLRPSQQFSVMSGRIHRFLGIAITFGRLMYLAKGNNTAVQVRIETPTL